MVLGTYIPIALLGIQGTLGWILLGIVYTVTIIGILFTAINIDKFQLVSVLSHLLNGWSLAIGIPKLLTTMGVKGLIFLALGGVMYTIGSILYGLGAHKKYMHCVFHFFCLLGTFFHFASIYFYLI